MKNQLNENICPFCKSPNNCKMESGSKCWCVDVKVPTQLLDLVPTEFKRKACICLQCINSYKENTELFKSNYCEKLLIEEKDKF